MAKHLSENEVAEILKVSPATVHRLFDKKSLTGFKWGFEWRTTEEILEQDIQIMSDEERIEILRSGAHVSLWEPSSTDNMLRHREPPENDTEAGDRPAEAVAPEESDEPTGPKKKKSKPPRRRKKRRSGMRSTLGPM